MRLPKQHRDLNWVNTVGKKNGADRLAWFWVASNFQCIKYTISESTIKQNAIKKVCL